MDTRATKRSSYEEYFIRNQELAECTLCNRKVSCSGDEGNDNLRTHLFKYHKREVDCFGTNEKKTRTQSQRVVPPKNTAPVVRQNQPPRSPASEVTAPVARQGLVSRPPAPITMAPVDQQKYMPRAPPPQIVAPAIRQNFVPRPPAPGVMAPIVQQKYVHRTPAPQVVAPAIRQNFVPRPPAPGLMAPVDQQKYMPRAPAPPFVAPVVRQNFVPRSPAPGVMASVACQKYTSRPPAREAVPPVIRQNIVARSPAPKAAAPVGSQETVPRSFAPEASAPVDAQKVATRSPAPEAAAPVDAQEVATRSPAPEAEAPAEIVHTPLEKSIVVENWTGSNKYLSEPDSAIVSLICQDGLPLTVLEGQALTNVLRFGASNLKLQPMSHYLNDTLPKMISIIEDKMRIELTVLNNVTVTVDTFEPENSTRKFYAVNAYYMNPETMVPKKILIDYKAVSDKYEEMPAMFAYSKIFNLTEGKPVKLVYHTLFAKESYKPKNEMSILPSFEVILQEIFEETFKRHFDFLRHQKRLLLQYAAAYRKYFTEARTVSFGRTSLTREIISSTDNFSWRDRKQILDFLIDSSLPREECVDENELYATLLMSEESFEIAKMMHGVLKEMDETVNLLHHTNYPTASVIIPTLQLLYSKLENLGGDPDHDDNIFAVASDSVRAKIITCESLMVLKTSTFLDPRFKEKFFTESHSPYMLRKFKDTAVMMYSDDPEEEEDGLKHSQLTQFDLYVKNQDGQKTRKKTAKFEKELFKYKNERPHSNTDPTKYWNLNGARFPILKNLATAFLAIPASASGAKILSQRGERISPVTDESPAVQNDFIFLYSNLEQYPVF